MPERFYRPPDSELASDPSEWEWTYRCADCGHGARLEAHSLAVACGPLHPDGELARHDNVDDTELFEDSIRCTEHIDAVIEHRVRGEWRRWYSCDRCMGSGKVRDYFSVSRPCPADGYGGEGGPHSGWLVPSPLESAATST